MKKNGLKKFFVCGPGFQMAQIFVESIFERYVDWDKLINEDDNFKNILQVKIQKQFKTTPDYLELESDEGYYMGVYLCLGQPIYSLKPEDADDFTELNSFEEIQNKLDTDGKIFICLGKSKHKVKKKAEQCACENALKNIT